MRDQGRERASNGDGPRRKVRNLGRQNLRKVRRPDGDRTEVKEEASEEASEEVENGSESDVREPESKPIGDTETYDALLTLLQASHDEKKEDGKDREKKRKIEEAEEEEDERIAGAEVGLDEGEAEAEEDGGEDGEDGEEVEEGEDVEEDKEVSSYVSHFDVDDSYIDKEESLLKERWTIGQKFDFGDYSAVFQVPPGKVLSKDRFTFDRDISHYPIKKRVGDAFNDLNLPYDRVLLDPMLSYKDILFPYGSYKKRNYRHLYAMHAVNHIYKSRDRILKNNEKLHEFRNHPEGEEPEFKDQGFTRPKVLILLPNRSACYEVVQLLISLSRTDQQENKKKFQDQFYNDQKPPESKPEDFRDAFKGNNNDFFCLGIKFTRKTLRLYASFYSSDIILASPIGLAMILEKKKQFDFLSSIELLVVDGANQIEMQNWDHVTMVMKHLNKIPKEFHDTDFSRVRMWYINGQARLLRQTLVFSEYVTPNITNLVWSKSQNLGGKFKFRKKFDASNAMMNSIGMKIKQIFQRFESESPVDDAEARFKFFINSALPSFTKSTSYDDGFLIYIPSYFDYLRVKNFMKTSTKHNFGSIDEYSSQSKLSRTRHQFATGKIKILLYTERLHYFRRFEIAGVKNVLMYGLPTNPLFYKELIMFVGKSIFKESADVDLSFVKILFSKWDAVSLERIVGSQRAPVLCNSVNEIYEFR